MRNRNNISFALFVLLPAALFSQTNNPVSNIQVQTNVNSNNENIFVIQTTVTGIEIGENKDDGDPQYSNQQYSVPQVNSPQMNMQRFSYGGGGSFTSGKTKSSYSFQKSKIKMDKRIQRFFNKHNKRKNSTNRCFSWR
jgi:hypothetical protein